jgi:hypothetical protein
MPRVRVSICRHACLNPVRAAYSEEFHCTEGACRRLFRLLRHPRRCAERLQLFAKITRTIRVHSGKYWDPQGHPLNRDR